MSDGKNLEEYPWNTRYSSATNNLIEDFFVPALSRSKFYYRIAAYFSSTSIAAAARGISAFVEHGEKMQLIIGNQLSEDDAEAINKGNAKIEDILNKKWILCKEEFENDVIKKRFEFLAWLIANEKLDIKIGVNKDKRGNFLHSEESLFHEKVLIFEDFDENRIQVDGSINETWKAWKENRESFCVHRSWEEGQKEYVESSLSYFKKIWDNEDKVTEVMDFPTALKRDLISIRPKNIPNTDDELDFIEYPTKNSYSNEITDFCSHEDKSEYNNSCTFKSLRNYQNEAIRFWLEHNFCGILEMATGTGKTFTALNAIKTQNLNSKILIVAVPQRELANQWVEECENIFCDTPHRILLCYSNTGWKDNIDRIIYQSQKEEKLCILVVVFATMRTNLFREKMKKQIDNMYLVIDEVHEMGSKQNQKLFSEFAECKIRLGLSATPERAWDEKGNMAIRNYFGDRPVFVWDMGKAINPPDGYNRCLCEYKYHLHECSLDEYELNEYEELSDEINRQVAIETDGGKISINEIDMSYKLKILLNKRASLIKSCSDKYRSLREILEIEAKSLHKCLVYCENKKHMNEVTKIIEKMGLDCRQFYGDLPQDKKEKVLDSFKDGDLQFIVAIKCLDQGIDIPVCDSAIILASSRNPREYIQRRGRILRLHEEKEFAIIHDFLVLPYPVDELLSGKRKLYDYERNIIKNQIERMNIFMDNANNSTENLIKKLELADILINTQK